jgi:group I intron endonuclease
MNEYKSIIGKRTPIKSKQPRVKTTRVVKVGVYYIRCIVNNYYYIGSSNDIDKRITQHKCLLRTNKHICKQLQDDYNKHGKESFVFDVIKLCDSINIKETETDILKNSIFKHYNLYNTVISHKTTFVSCPVEYADIIRKVIKGLEHQTFKMESLYGLIQ